MSIRVWLTVILVVAILAAGLDHRIRTGAWPVGPWLQEIASEEGTPPAGS